MKSLQSKHVAMVGFLTASMAVSVSSFAQEAPLEQVLAATIQQQGQKMVKELSTQLTNSIELELQRFSSQFLISQPQQLAKQAKQTEATKAKQISEE